MRPYFEIDGRKVGYDYDPLVIAEIGINHEGSLETAFSMVDAAISAGAEIIKHQTHIVADEMTNHAKKIIPGNAKESIYEIMERCALSEEDELELKKYVEQKGGIFISTPFSRAAANRLRKFEISAYKIGSGECNNYPLIEHVSSFGKPIILSTGMNSIESIRPAVKIMEKNKVPYALLHCTNVYPTPPQLIRLGAISQLEESFPSAVVGLSDHSTSNLACTSAVALGASILERHFTDRMDRPGPDINCSMDTKALADLIEQSRLVKQMRGGNKIAVEEEKVTIDFAFASVCTIKTIKKGDIFNTDNLWVKRPGTGELLADRYTELMGKKATRNLEENEQLKKIDVLGMLDDC